MKRLSVAVCHPGTQHAPWLVTELQRVGLLAGYWTGIAVSDSGFFRRWVGRSAQGRLARMLAKRTAHRVPAAKLHLRPLGELIAALRKRLGHDEQRFLHRRNEAFQRSLPRRLFQPGMAVVGFDTAGWIMAERCREAGGHFFLDQSIGHPVAKERVYGHIRQRFPEWSETLDVRDPIVLAAEGVEQRLATRVVAASSFTKRTLIEAGVAPERIVVNPYGVEVARFTPRFLPLKGRPLRFVFVGLVSARKGIPLLLQVWARLGFVDAELWIVGHVSARVSSLVAGVRNVVVRGPVPHNRIPEILQECDVFVFPSYFEGFGLVLIEAMACGLPIIATDATGAPDLITDGNEGFLFPAGDEHGLARHLARFVSEPSLAQTMGRAARRTAERFSWEAYGDRWAAMVETVANDEE